MAKESCRMAVALRLLPRWHSKGQMSYPLQETISKLSSRFSWARGIGPQALSPQQAELLVLPRTASSNGLAHTPAANTKRHVANRRLDSIVVLQLCGGRGL